MTKLPHDENLPAIEPLDLSDIHSKPAKVTTGGSSSHHSHHSHRFHRSHHTSDAQAESDVATSGSEGEGAAVAGRAARASTVRTLPNGNEVIEDAETGEVLIRKRKRRKSAGRRTGKARRRLITVGAVVVALVVAAFATLSIGSYSLHHNGFTAGTLLGTNKSAAVVYDEGRTVQFEGSTYAYKTNMVSILFMGYDERKDSSNPSQADALILLAFDTDTGKVTGIVVPRDSMVEVDAVIGKEFTGIDTMQVCLAFAYGDNNTKSCELTSRAVSRLMYNIPVSAYYALNMQGVGVLNDAIGGVALTPIATIPSAGAVEGVPTVLQGSQALSYVQSRGTELDASLNRQDRQVQYVKAFAAQALKAAKGDVGLLLDLFRLAGDYSITNLGISEVSYLATRVLAHGITSLETKSLQGEMVQGDIHAEFYLDYDNVFRTILDTYYVKLDEDAAASR